MSAPTPAMASRYERNSVFPVSCPGSPRRTYQNRAKFVPATIMNGMMVHWTAGLNASTLRASGENPPVGIVVSACATALKRSMFGATPARCSR